MVCFRLVGCGGGGGGGGSSSSIAGQDSLLSFRSVDVTGRLFFDSAIVTPCCEMT